MGAAYTRVFTVFNELSCFLALYKLSKTLCSLVIKKMQKPFRYQTKILWATFWGPNFFIWQLKKIFQSPLGACIKKVNFRPCWGWCHSHFFPGGRTSPWLDTTSQADLFLEWLQKCLLVSCAEEALGKGLLPGLGQPHWPGSHWLLMHVERQTVCSFGQTSVYYGTDESPAWTHAAGRWEHTKLA